MCWKVTLSNGTIYGFTSHTGNLVVSGITYQAAAGYTPTAIASNADLAVDNLDVIGFLDSAVITESDIQAGLWDFAAVQIFQVNYLDISMGVLNLRSGRLGEIKTTRQQFVAELRGMTQQLQQVIGQIYAPACRADLGDARCKIVLSTLTVTGSVTSIVSNRFFYDTARAEVDGYFDNGKVTFNSGANLGLSMEIKSNIAQAFQLQLQMPYTIAVGDTYSMSPGCKKRVTEDCKTKFNNVINFRGEPHVPGNDELSKVGGA